MTLRRVALGLAIVSCAGFAGFKSNKTKQIEHASVSAAQAECSAQAAARVVAFGHSPVVATSHYNALLSKCFLRIDNTNSTSALTTTAISLLDVSTNREIGEFFRTVAQGDSIEEAPALCNLVISDQEKSCTSPEQFTALARHYME